MLWHEGTIPEAINLAKVKKAIFMVFVAGDDDQSQQMTKSFEDPSVSQMLSCSNCVAVKLDANGENSKQFSQISDPVVLIPSTYFIGVNGLPLEVIGGHLDAKALLGKINKVFELHEKDVKSPQQNDSGFASVVPSGATPSSQAEAGASNSAESSADTSLDDRVQRAKELISQKREIKMMEEEEEEKQKEIERRKIGKDVQKQKMRQQEQEAKQLAELIAKEKAEEQAARERIREQIASDRAERAVKYNAEKAKQEEQRQEIQRTRLREEQEKASAEAALRSQFARIQFRLPDGSSVMQQFDASATLDALFNYVKETVKPPFGSFVLSLAFPRREFTLSDYSQTLRDLQLSPSASILILPTRQAVTRSSASGIVGVLLMLLSPLMTMWKMLQVFFFGSGRPATGGVSPSTSGNTSAPRSNARASNTAQQRGARPGEKPFSRREGNVHRLVDESSEDNDENNTWNGNSTQQM